MRVWLDDLRPAPPGWRWTKTVRDTIRLLKTGRVREISLDYDLDYTDGHHKGIEVLEWLAPSAADGTLVLPVIHFHSANPQGAADMTWVWQQLELRHGLSWA
jgi:hypothetical protein